MRRILAMTTMILAGALSTGPAAAQQGAKADAPGRAEEAASQLIGAWRLVSAVSEEVETAKKFEPYGPNPTGYIVYLPGGAHVCARSTRRSRTGQNR